MNFIKTVAMWVGFVTVYIGFVLLIARIIHGPAELGYYFDQPDLEYEAWLAERREEAKWN